MEVLRVEESREPCAESGWYAYDLALSRPVMRKDILSLRTRGSDLSGAAQDALLQAESAVFLSAGNGGRGTAEAGGVSRSRRKNLAGSDRMDSEVGGIVSSEFSAKIAKYILTSL